MKRIIDGVTYNTDTATLVASSSETDEDVGTVAEYSLYQNRAGVYFNVDEITTTYRARDGETKERTNYEWSVVGDAARARDWCEQYGLTIIRDIEDMPPEAEPGEKLATLYVRLPPVLKDAISAQAEAKKISANIYALRCLEECQDRNRGPNAYWNSLAGLEQVEVVPAQAWGNEADEAWGGTEDDRRDFRKYRFGKLNSLINKLQAVRDAYPDSIFN